MTDHRQQAIPGTASMNIAIASPHRTEWGTHIGSNGFEDGFTKREAACAIPDQWGENIAFLKVNADRDAKGLLSAAEENATMDFSGAVQARKFIVEQPCQQHEAVGSQSFVPWNGAFVLDRWCR
jgi:hypothetical protein